MHCGTVWLFVSFLDDARKFLKPLNIPSFLDSCSNNGYFQLGELLGCDKNAVKCNFYCLSVDTGLCSKLNGNETYTGRDYHSGACL